MSEPVAFLDRLPEHSLVALRRAWVRRSLARGAAVLLADSPERDVFFVLEGTARALVQSAAGRPVSYKDFGPGEIFGEFGVIDRQPRSTDVVAVTELIVGQLGGSRFRRLVEADPALAWALLEHLAAQARMLNRRVFEFTTMMVRERLLGELLRLAQPGDAGDPRPRIAPPPTHQELAARISTHREAVSREMSRLARQGIVARTAGALVIADVERLRAGALSRSDTLGAPVPDP